jgi:hypothetical protein
MAPTQNIARALRERFGSEETIITLAEILSFLESHQKQPAKAGKQKQQQPSRGIQQNATLETQPREVTREARATPAITTTTTTQSQGITCQITRHAEYQDQGLYNSVAEAPRSLSPRRGQPAQPSYADIAKKAPERPTQQPKPLALPESVKLAPRALKPIKIGLQKPIKETPSELINYIKERAVNGERLASLIKAFKILSPRRLLVYPTMEVAREELSQNTSWLDAIHASIYTRNYSIVIYRVKRGLPIDEISRKIREQNSIFQNGILTSSWLGGKEGSLEGTLKIDVKDPIVANRAILRGIALDYELKKVYQYIPRKRTPIKQREKLFYKEKAPILPTRIVFSTSKEANEPPTQEEDWTLVEGTRKRRQIAPRGRGRPKAFEKIDNSQGNIDGFVILATQEPPKSINVE